LQGVNFGRRYPPLGGQNCTPNDRLGALQRLDLSGTGVAGLEPLRSLTALQSLDLAQTPITSLEPLRWLKSLQSLDVSGTPVPSLEPVYSLPDLHLRNAGNLAEAVLKPFTEYRKERQLPQ
jgi:Leucine-rich repeat (LRR) protein